MALRDRETDARISGLDTTYPSQIEPGVSGPNHTEMSENHHAALPGSPEKAKSRACESSNNLCAADIDLRRSKPIGLAVDQGADNERGTQDTERPRPD